MITFLTTIHILACLGLIILVLLQDSKGGGMFSSQSSSNSVLGATGGATLSNNLTKIISIILALTCLSLAVILSKSQKSVVDTGVMAGSSTGGSAATPQTNSANTTTSADATTSAPTESKK